MFNIFKKKSPEEQKKAQINKLQKKYKQLLEESHKLSHQDRTAGDAKLAEAEEVLKQIDEIQEKE